MNWHEQVCKTFTKINRLNVKYMAVAASGFSKYGSGDNCVRLSVGKWYQNYSFLINSAINHLKLIVLKIGTRSINSTFCIIFTKTKIEICNKA